MKTRKNKRRGAIADRIATVARYGPTRDGVRCTAVPRAYTAPFVVRQNWTRVAADRDVPYGTVSNQYAASTYDSKVHGNEE